MAVYCVTAKVLTATASSRPFLHTNRTETGYRTDSSTVQYSTAQCTACSCRTRKHYYLLIQIKSICAFADDMFVTTRNIPALKDVLLALEIEGGETGLRIRDSRPKHTNVSSTQARRCL